MVENYRMITAQDILIVLSSLVAGNTESFDRFKLEDIANSRFLIKSCLSKIFQVKFQVRFGRLK